MNVDKIDLNRHAVIEASAGTGKTYTIEQLVLRILRETGTPIEEILLVTFTEKATGELKGRLRHTLERAVDDHPETLRPALDHFDQASICTIHSFCQRLLQEFALEQSQDFNPALVSDKELMPQMLHEVQRRLWRAHFGDSLRDVLDRAGFNRVSAEKWNACVLNVAEKYHARSEHRLLPAAVADWWRRLDEPGASWPGQLQVYTIEAVRQLLAEHKQQRGLQSFDDMIAAVEMSLDAEHNPDAPSLLNRLRTRYRFGIVDEFQDTDPLQWRIFRRIFVEGGNSRLFVVGDPKQAIFGFRSADLPTYLSAARELTTERNAALIPLDTNWRSAPELLEALNCVFQDGEWFPEEKGIKYREVHAPTPEQRQARILEDRTGRAALTVVDVSAPERLKEAHKLHCRFVAGEIQRLLHGSAGRPSLEFADKRGDHALQASDICVLVLKWRDAEPLTDALKELGIPFSLQRQSGFWQSAEVRHLETLLTCLSQPEERSAFRKALLTCFFRIRPADLVQNQDLPPSHPARHLYRTWLEHAEARRWSALFHSLLEQTGLLLQAMDDADAAQRLTSLRHLMGTLERLGHGENRDLLGLIDWIREQRRRGDAAEAEQPPAEAQRRVRIMTIHASKGLEFPIVFLAGGFTKKSGPPTLTEYRDEQGRKVFDLCPDSAAQQKTADDAMSELRRLYYVALTRPMFKLYVPMVQVANKMRAWAGPIGTVLLPALKQAMPDKLGMPIADVVVVPRLLVLGGAEPEAAAARLDTPPPFAWSGPLFPVLDPNLDRRRIIVRSFSSMSRKHVAHIADGPSYGDRVQLAQDETHGAAEKDDPLRGPVFGDIVHKVLEAIDFAEVGRCKQPADLLAEAMPARLLIEAQVRANVANLRSRSREGLEAAAQAQVAQLVFNALHTPLAEAGGQLHRIPEADRLSEVEFQFPEQHGDIVPVHGRLEKNGFVTGFMDLVFRAAGRYFLVDYKTNLLPGYTPDHLQRCMDDSDYHRQYRLYLHALDRWLSRVHGKSFSFAQQFGGVYYLFVRGLNGLDESAGVFFHRPTPADIDLARTMQS